MLDAGRTACEDLISASQVQRYPEPLSEPHERIVLAVNERVSSALHVGFLWQTNEFAVKISVTRSAPSQPLTCPCETDSLGKELSCSAAIP